MSWIIMRAGDGKVIMETFNEKTAQHLKTRLEFLVVPSRLYLESFNRAVRENNGTQPPDIQTLNIIKNALSISLEK